MTGTRAACGTGAAIAEAMVEAQPNVAQGSSNMGQGSSGAGQGSSNMGQGSSGEEGDSQDGKRKLARLLAEPRQGVGPDLYELVAMLGHELRNPLAAIRTAADLLKVGQPDRARLKRLQEVLERQTTHMARLIEELSDVARIGRGHIELDSAPVDLAALAEEAVVDWRPELQRRSLRFDVDLPPSPLMVQGDRARLAQIVELLIAQAVRMGEPQGCLSLRLRRSGDDVDVAIASDRGSLPPEGDRLRARRQGIGAALLEGLIALHRGVIYESSGVGSGFELRVRVPLVAPSACRAASGSSAGRRKVLVVEDNRDGAEVLRNALELAGYGVEVSYEGRAAIATAASFRPDVVLCDIGLPGGMDGYALARELRRSSPGRAPVLVALSGRELEQGVESGFDEHLVKPVELAILQSVIARLCD